MTVITCVWGSLSQLPLCPQIPLWRTGRGRLRLRAAGADGERRHSQQCSYLLGCHGGLKTSWNKKKGKKRRKPRLQNGVGIDFFFLYVFFFFSSPSAVRFSSFLPFPGFTLQERGGGSGRLGAQGPGTFSPGSFCQFAPSRGSSDPTEMCTRERSFSAVPKVTFGEVSALSLRASQGLHLKILGCQRSPKLNLCLTLLFSSPFILDI